MRQIREFRSNFENISRDCRKCLTTFPRIQLIFILIRTTVARHSCECRTTFVRMSLSFIFSPGNREVFACFLKTQEFRIVNSQNFAATGSRYSHERRATVARQSRDSLAIYFGEKMRILKFLNMFKTFSTSSRHMKILTTLVRHSHECRAKVCDKIRKTVARNSHASETLA